MSFKECDRFELILDYSDEIGVSDNVSGDVIAMRVNQSPNTVGFCTNIVTLMNHLNSEIEFKERIIRDKSQLVKHQLETSQHLTRRVDELEKENKVMENKINKLKNKADKYIQQQYNLPYGTDLSYWTAVKNTCTQLLLNKEDY